MAYITTRGFLVLYSVPSSSSLSSGLSVPQLSSAFFIKFRFNLVPCESATVIIIFSCCGITLYVSSQFPVSSTFRLLLSTTNTIQVSRIIYGLSEFLVRCRLAVARVPNLTTTKSAPPHGMLTDVGYSMTRFPMLVSSFSDTYRQTLPLRPQFVLNSIGFDFTTFS